MNIHGIRESFEWVNNQKEIKNLLIIIPKEKVKGVWEINRMDKKIIKVITP